MGRYLLNVYFDGDKQTVYFDAYGNTENNNKKLSSLCMIDLFTMHAIDGDKQFGFESEKELKDYLNNHGFNIPANSDIKINYKYNGKEKSLDVQYEWDPVLEYFCRHYLYFQPTKEKSPEYTKLLMNDPTYNRYLKYIRNICKDNKEFLFFASDEKYTYSGNIDSIHEYIDHSDSLYRSSIEATNNAIDKLARGFTRYKQIRGMQNAIHDFQKSRNVILPLFNISDALENMRTISGKYDVELLKTNDFVSSLNDEDRNNLGIFTSEMDKRDNADLLDEWYSFNDDIPEINSEIAKRR